MRIGLQIGPEYRRYDDKVARLVADAQGAEAAGFESVWVPQIPGEFDALTAVTLMGQATERVELGTAVLPIQTRHPIAMAQEVLSVQAVCEGRFVPGIGPSHHWIIDDMLGLPYEKPASLVRDYLEVPESERVAMAAQNQPRHSEPSVSFTRSDGSSVPRDVRTGR